MKLHPKISELKRRATHLNSRGIAINELGELVDVGGNLDKRIIEGYVVIWGKANQHRERWHKGSWAKSIREHGPQSNSNFKIKMLAHHNPEKPIALFEIIEERELGVYFKTLPLDEGEEEDKMLRQIRSGLVNNFSFGFNYVWDKMEWNEEEQLIDIYEGAVFEISPVSIPSELESFVFRGIGGVEDLYDDTEAFIKSLPRKFQLEARHYFSCYKACFIREMGMGEGKKRKNKNIQFINEMIPHHEAALDMVEAYQDEVDDKNLLKIMANIKKGQTEEIKEMKAIKKELTTRHKSLVEQEPLEQRNTALSDAGKPTPDVKGINYNFLIQNF